MMSYQLFTQQMSHPPSNIQGSLSYFISCGGRERQP